MSDDDTSAESTSTGPESSTGSDAPIEGGGGEGIELTTGEPNSFEPEEDPDAADG